MVDKNIVDKIYVEQNEQMTEVINWVDENLDDIARVLESNPDLDFPTYPMDSGLIWMEEEGIDFTFEVINPDEVEITYYPNHIDYPLFKFKTSLGREEKDIVHDLWINKSQTGNQLNDQRLRIIIELDNTPWKTAHKFIALMMFMLFHEGDVVQVDDSKSETRSKREVRKVKSRTGKVIPLVKKTYVIKNFEPKKIKVSGAPRKYTKPDHEVSVRGHYRHLKSGKVIWVRASTKYGDKGKGKPKTYKL